MSNSHVRTALSRSVGALVVGSLAAATFAEEPAPKRGEEALEHVLEGVRGAYRAAGAADAVVDRASDTGPWPAICEPAIIEAISDLSDPITLDITVGQGGGVERLEGLILSAGIEWIGLSARAIGPVQFGLGSDPDSDDDFTIGSRSSGGDVFVSVTQRSGPLSLLNPDRGGAGPTAPQGEPRFVNEVRARGRWGQPLDFNCDGNVTLLDAVELIDAYGPCFGCREDLDGSGVVDEADLAIFLDLLFPPGG